MPKYRLTAGTEEKILDTETVYPVDSFFIDPEGLRWRVRGEVKDEAESVPHGTQE